MKKYILLSALSLGMVSTTAHADDKPIVIDKIIASVPSKEEQEQARIKAEQEKLEAERLNKEQPLKVFDVTAQFESGNRNPGALLGTLNDGAGQNYGTYSLTERYTMRPYLNFLEKHYPELRSQLSDDVGSANFNALWKQLGETNPDLFKQSQAQFIFEKYGVPTLEKLQQETGVNFLDGTHSIGSVGMISGMIHNAGQAWYPVIKQAVIQTRDESPTFNDDLFIERAGGWVRDNYSGVYTSSIRNRYRKQVPQEQARKDKIQYIKQGL